MWASQYSMPGTPERVISQPKISQKARARDIAGSYPEMDNAGHERASLRIRSVRIAGAAYGCDVEQRVGPSSRVTPIRMSQLERRFLVTRLGSLLLNAPMPVVRTLAGREPTVIDGRTLNVRLQALLAIGAKLDRPDRGHDLAKVRGAMDKMARWGMPRRTGVSVSGIRLGGPGGDLPVRVYRSDRAVAVPPVIVYFHGGGWATCGLDTHDGSCRLLADESKCTVVSVDYRLAPEHSFPAAVDDAFFAYRWVRDNAEALSVSRGRVGVMGDSAGGTLAAAVSVAARDVGAQPPFAQCLVYPSLDATISTASCTSMGDGPWLSYDDIVWYRSMYLPDPATWTSPLASPARVADLSIFPPTLLYAAGFDPLRDDAELFADGLDATGVPVRYRCFDDQIHGFFGMGILHESMAIAVEICTAMGEEMHRPLAHTSEGPKP